jgi:hypothetical protein
MVVATVLTTIVLVFLLCHILKFFLNFVELWAVIKGGTVLKLSTEHKRVSDKKWWKERRACIHKELTHGKKWKSGWFYLILLKLFLEIVFSIIANAIHTKLTS